MKTWIKLILAAGIGVILSACASEAGTAPQPGETVSTDPKFTDVKVVEVGQYEGYDVVKFCDGRNAIYVLAAYRAMSVVKDDPFCADPNAYGPGVK